MTERRAEKPANEEARLRALESYEILDTLPEAKFDELVELASELCGVPIAMVSLIDDDRQWMKAKIGMSGDEIGRDVSFCTHAVLANDLMIVTDATTDPRFVANPFVTAEPHIRFYAGMPIRSQEGLPLGTLCVVDNTARKLTPVQEKALQVLARQVEAQLELRKAAAELARREAAALTQRDAITELVRQKRQLSAMIVHDLKSPIQDALLNVSFVAESHPISDDARAAATEAMASIDTMNELVVNLLNVSRADDVALNPVPEDVDIPALFDEIRQSTERRVRSARRTLTLARPGVMSLRADRALLRRVLQNLVENAIKYGGENIALEASTGNACSELSVRDDGEGIPEAARETIFARYARVDSPRDPHASSSSGLGLTFCKMAVEAHGGRIWVEANEPGGSVFRIRLPRRD